MQPEGMCETHRILKDRMRADLRIYRDAVNELDSSSGLNFAEAHRKAEHTRLAYEAARELLRDHIASHGCG